jgi:pyruvate kinase
MAWQVLEVLDNTRVRGRVLNTHKLGQRKNCNLPGVLVDLPVLGPKDIDDVRNFAARHQMDYIFASFVQRAEDVRMIRAVRLGTFSKPLGHSNQVLTATKADWCW